MELDRFTGGFPHTRHTPEASEIVPSPHQMATDYVWLKTQIGLIPSGIPALARIWLKTRLDSKSSGHYLARARVPPPVLLETRGILILPSQRLKLAASDVPYLSLVWCHADAMTMRLQLISILSGGVRFSTPCP